MKFLFLMTLALVGCHVDQEQTVNIPVAHMEQVGPHQYDKIVLSDGTEYHTGLIKGPANMTEARTYEKFDDCGDLPEEFDLRELGVVPDIRNQGGCGSCWSFSMTGSLESALMAGGLGKLDLSEQELVSCDKKQWGCDGGLLQGFGYQIKHGQGLESEFGYTSGKTGSNGKCKDIPAAGKGVSFAYVGAAGRSPTEKEVKCALYTSHTIPWITVSASNSWGNFPKDEKTLYTKCGRGQTNHAIGIVGWRKEDPKNHKSPFIIKNSWGTNWGAKGFGSMNLGCDSLGEEVAFIRVK